MAIVADTNLAMVRGDTFAFGVEIELDGEEQAVEIDEAYFSCKKTARDSDYIFQKSLGNGITKVDDKTYRVRVAPEDTKDVDPGSYRYDFEIRVDDDIYTPLKGELTIMEDVTRDV